MYRKKIAPVTECYKVKLETTPGKRKTGDKVAECSPEKKECKTPTSKVADVLEKLTFTSAKKATRRSLNEARRSVSQSPFRGKGRPVKESLEPKFIILPETDANLEMEVEENDENIPPEKTEKRKSAGRGRKIPVLELEPKETRRSVGRATKNLVVEMKSRLVIEEETPVETSGKVLKSSSETKYLKIKPIFLKKIPDTTTYRISNTPRTPGTVRRSVGRVQKIDLDYDESESSSDSDSDSGDESSSGSSKSMSPLRKTTRRMEEVPRVCQDPKNLMDLRSLLHTSEIPMNMPCREEEHKVIRQFIVNGVKQNSSSQAMYISGVPGTGKTASTQAVVKEVAKKFKFNYVAVNAMELMDPKQLFIEIYKGVVSEKKRISPQSARIKLNHMFDKSDKKRLPVVILIDELDMLCTKKQEILYDVFNWTSCEEARVSVIAIANTLDLPERVMSQRITSRLGTNRVVFQPYTYLQIVEIVRARLSKGLNLVHEKAIEFVSKKVANVSGDLRKAIDLLRRGIEIAVERGDKTLLFDHVNDAQKESAAAPRNVIGESLSRHGFLLFRAAQSLVESSGLEEFRFCDLYRQYRILCTGLDGVNPIHDCGMHHILMELCSNRLLVASPGTDFTKRRIRLGMPTHDALSLIKQVDDARKEGRIVYGHIL